MKGPANSNMTWLSGEDSELRVLKNRGFSFKSISRKLHRSAAACSTRFWRLTHSATIDPGGITIPATNNQTSREYILVNGSGQMIAVAGTLKDLNSKLQSASPDCDAYRKLNITRSCYEDKA